MAAVRIPGPLGDSDQHKWARAPGPLGGVGQGGRGTAPQGGYAPGPVGVGHLPLSAKGESNCKDGKEPFANVLWFLPEVEKIMRVRGLEVGARLQHRWLTGRANRLIGDPDDGNGSDRPLAIETVSMDWALRFARAQSMFKELQDSDAVLSSKGQKRLRELIDQRFSQSQGARIRFGEFPEGRAREQYYVARASLDLAEAYTAGMDDLNAALGRFEMYGIPAGVATLTEQMRVRVEVDSIGVYIADSFDFEGEQPLGRWRVPDEAEMGTIGSDPSQDKHGQMRSICPEEWVYLSNWVYRMYRTESGQFGEDFLVYSDIKVVGLTPVLVFDYPAPDWLKPRFGRG
jgi:hypothetical protein